jgi:hypothetical protein
MVDQVVVINERHFRRLLRGYVSDCQNSCRPHYAAYSRYEQNILQSELVHLQ